MASGWYFTWDDKTFGPFSSATLRELAALGRLQPTDLVWKEGSAKRVRAAEVKHLFADFPTKTIALAENALPEARPSSLQQQPAGLCASNPLEAKKLAPWPSLANYRPGPDAELRDTIPDGLELKELPPEKPSRHLEPDPEEDW
jgi:uncharacterized protein DUF4339